MSNALHFLLWAAGLRPARSQTTEIERGAILRHASGRKRLAEIGVFQGVTTRALRAAADPDGVLLAIDPFSRGLLGLRGYGWARIIAHREVAKARGARVIWVEAEGHRAPELPVVRGALPVDFVFIDGDHSYEGAERDWNAWRAVLSPEAIVALHDSDKRMGCGAERFTKEVILHDPEFELIEVVESLTVVRKVSPR